MTGIIEIMGFIIAIVMVMLFMVILPIVVVVFLFVTVKDRREFRKLMADRADQRQRLEVEKQKTMQKILELPSEEQKWWRSTMAQLQVAEKELERS